MTDHIDLDARDKRLAVILAAAAAYKIDVTLDDCDFLDALVAVVRTRLAMEKADEGECFVAFWTARREFQAAMEPFRPVAPSATDAAATGEQP